MVQRLFPCFNGGGQRVFFFGLPWVSVEAYRIILWFWTCGLYVLDFRTYVASYRCGLLPLQCISFSHLCGLLPLQCISSLRLFILSVAEARYRRWQTAHPKWEKTAVVLVMVCSSHRGRCPVSDPVTVPEGVDLRCSQIGIEQCTRRAIIIILLEQCTRHHVLTGELQTDYNGPNY